MPTKAFLISRKQGEVAQHFVAGMFRNWKLTVSETPRGYRPSYDGIASGAMKGTPVTFRYEVKYDKLASKTRNLYLDINSLCKSEASILTICLNDPIDTVLIIPLQDALEYAVRHENINGGEYNERSACVPISQFISDLKPKVLTTSQ